MNKSNQTTGRVLLLGVGGVSMHQLARAYDAMGWQVRGYDAKENSYTRELTSLGIPVTNKFLREYAECDLCVKTGAIPPTNRYLKVLKKREVKVIDRAEALAHFCQLFGMVIAVAGTHGKSTTASLIYQILRSAGRKVSCHIGADVPFARFNPHDDILVVEACEYNKSFLSLHPDISVVTNVEAEHMDSYQNMFNLRSAFLTFFRRGKRRFAFDCTSTQFLRRVKNAAFVPMVQDGRLKPKIKGEYNHANISLALAVAESLGVDRRTALRQVNRFQNLPRRYQFLGKANRTKIFIDYAHHPSEIKAFCTAFSLEHRQPLIVFQPHTYSRTKNFLSQFVSVLSGQAHLVIFREYPARERPGAGLSAHDLYLEIKKVKPDVRYTESRHALSKMVRNYPAAAFVGAGDINQLAEQIVAKAQPNLSAKNYTQNG